MDFSTIEKKLNSNGYQHSAEFKADIAKVWANSYRYNDKTSPVYKMTQDMEKAYKKLENSLARKQKIEKFRSTKSVEIPMKMTS